MTASSRVDHDAYEEMFGEGGPGVADLTVEMDQGFPRVDIPVTVTEASPLAVNATAPTITDQPDPVRQREYDHGTWPHGFGRDIRRPRLFVDGGGWNADRRRYGHAVVDEAAGNSRYGLPDRRDRDGYRQRQ